jgi:RNA polymerase sigma-70 factor (ECF subfamily)
MLNQPAECNSLAEPVVDAPELSPERLVEQCQAGSLEAFESLVEHYEKRIFNFLCQMTNNPHDAEDLAQETFLKAYQSIHRFNSAHGFSTWLFTIAKRTAYNHFRAARRPQEMPREAEADFDDPSVLLEQKDEKTSLWKIAETLQRDQYEALWLRYGEGFSIAEAAKIMRTNQIRVRVLLHRARKTLAKTLRAAHMEMR